MRHALIALTAAYLVIQGLTAGCASKLKRDLTDKAPGGLRLEESLDTSAINFADVVTGEQVNLRAYMEASEHDFLLLTFGSKGCAACNRKAEHLKNEIIGRHPLYLTPPGKRFEIVGINTDKEPYARLAGYLSEYPFIKWSDPAGRTMLDYFMPPGNKFSVPLTVMINKDGIAWRVLPTAQVSVTELMGRVEVTLGLRDAVPPPTDGDGGDEGSDGTADGTDGSDGTSDGTDGTDTGVERLKAVSVSSCTGVASTLDAALGAGDYKFIQVAAGNCGDTCLANIAELKALAAACTAGGTGKSCAVASLQGGAPLATECASAIAYQGGSEFFTQFKSHFNWSYLPLVGPPPKYLLSLPPVEGPLLLGFSAKGELVYSKEGKLAAGELSAAMTAPGFGAIARGPDFRLYDKASGEFGFADLRRRARYTVVAAWAPLCGSCLDELKEWSQPGQIYDFCSERPGDCQIVAMETHLPNDPAQTIGQYYDGIMNGDGQGFDGLLAMHVKVPLILDPMPLNGPTGDEYLKRFFDGYMVATVPDYKSYSTFIYNQEGRIVATFESGNHTGEEPVLKKVRELLGGSL